MCLGVFLLGFIVPRTFCAYWTWLTVTFPMLQKLSAIISSNIFLRSFLSLFFWDPYNANVGAFNVSQGSLILSSFVFILFSLFCSMALISTILSSRSLICTSALVIQLLIPSSVFFTCYCTVHLRLLFSSSRSLLNISCIFLILASIIFLRSWIIFTIIILNRTLRGKQKENTL